MPRASCTPAGCVPPYPDEQAAQEALCHLADNSGDVACQKHCKWVLEGYLNSVSDPCPCPDASANQSKLDSALSPLKGKAGRAASLSINWQQLIVTILQILLGVLNPTPQPAPSKP